MGVRHIQPLVTYKCILKLYTAREQYFPTWHVTIIMPVPVKTVACMFSYHDLEYMILLRPPNVSQIMTLLVC